MERPHKALQTLRTLEATRREFLAGSAAALTLGAAGMGAPGCGEDGGAAPGSWPGRVVEVHDPQAVSSAAVDVARIKAMLAAGLRSLTGASDAAGAWRALLPDFSSTLRIGLKVNCLSAYLSNQVELVAAVVQSLVQDLGADPGRVVVWDRRGDELARAKLTAQSTGARVLGTEASLSDSSGPGYEGQARAVGGQSTRISRILTDETDVTINLPLLKTHNVSAATGALKNVYGCIHNPGSFHTTLNEDLPRIYQLAPVRGRMRLHITDGLRAVIKGDTADPPDAAPARVLLATDPVALDSRAVALINELRASLPKALPGLPAGSLAWLGNAEALGLGSTRVELKKVG